MHEGNGPSLAAWGGVRRDCEPHRGIFLKLLSALSMFLGLVSFCLWILALVGFPLGVAVWVMARQDQEKIHCGLMDPDGRDSVAVARKWAVNGLVLCTLAGAFWGYVLLERLTR